jgi:hypothetical protein
MTAVPSTLTPSLCSPAVGIRAYEATVPATPDFLRNLVALANFMRLSLRKGEGCASILYKMLNESTADPSTSLRSGRDDNYVAKCELSREIIDLK